MNRFDLSVQGALFALALGLWAGSPSMATAQELPGEPTIQDGANNDSPSGDSPSGDSPSGDSPSGDSPSGDSPSEDINDLELLLLSQTIDPIRAASFREQHPREAPAAVLVISDEEIRASGARTLGEVLERFGGLGLVGDDHLTIRGIGQTNNIGGVGDAGRVLLLIDGTRVNDVFSDTFNLGLSWGVEDIERIEVLKGPGSALYGTSAVAGVVNVVTKRGSEAVGVTGRLRVEGLDEQALAIRSGQTRGALSSALYGRVQTQGEGGAPRPVAAEVRGSLNRGGIDAAYGVHRTVETTPKAFGSEEGTPDETFTGAVSDEGYGSIQGNRSFGRVVSGTLKAQGTAKRNGLQGEEPALQEARFSGEGRLGLRFSTKSYLTTGVELRRETVTFRGRPGGGDAQDLARLVGAGYGELEMGPFAYTTLTAGVRAEGYVPSENGVAAEGNQMITPRLGIVVALPDSTHIKVLYGEAFQSPSLALLFSDTEVEGITFLSNSELNPERLRSLEVEVSRYLSRHVLAQVNVFQTRIGDLITPSFTSTQNTLAFINLYDAQVRGIEGGISLAFSQGIRADANVTLLDAYSLDTYLSLPLVPKVMANGTLTLTPWDRWTGFLAINAIGARSGSQGDAISSYLTLPANIRLDISQIVQVSERLDLAISLRNVLGAGRLDLEGGILTEGVGTEAFIELRLRPPAQSDGTTDYAREGL